MRSAINNKKGFTLIEIAIILIILGIFVAFGVEMLGVLLKGNRLNETREAIKDAKHGLIGYAMKNHRLPCPDTYADSNYDGAEDCTYSPSSPYKNTKLPYITIGIRGKDPYLKQIYYDVNESLTTTSDGYTFCTALKTMTGGPQITQDGGSNYSSAVAIVLSTSENLSLDSSINNTDTRNYESKGPTADFDDIVEWVELNKLIAKMGCQEDCSSYAVYNSTGVTVYAQGGVSGCREIIDSDTFDVRSGDTINVYLASDCTDCSCTPINSAVTYPASQTTDTDEDCAIQSTDAVSFTLSDY